MRALWLPLLMAGAGTLVMRRWRPAGHPAEQVGLGILLGLGGTTLMIFVVHALGVPLVLPLALLPLAGFTLLWGLTRRRSAPSVRHPEWTPAEVLLALVLVLLLGVSAARASFYPVSAMDAHSYDGRARWIVAEKTLDLSVYGEYRIGSGGNLAYPPLFPLSLALAYWGGAEEAKPLDTLYLASLILVLYGWLSRQAPRLAALGGALLVAAAPELWLHGSLCLTNLPATAFLSAGLLAAVDALRSKAPPSDWLLAGAFLLFAAGIRADAVALIVPLSAVLALMAVRTGLTAREGMIRLAALALPALTLVVAWQVQLRGMVGPGDATFRRSLLPDAWLLGRVTSSFAGLVLNPGLYGWTLYAFAASTVLAIFKRSGESTPHRALLWSSLAAAIGLLVLYQQIDPSFGGGDFSYLRNSLKRGLFYLLPGAAAAAVLAPPVVRGFRTLDRWQRS